MTDKPRETADSAATPPWVKRSLIGAAAAAALLLAMVLSGHGPGQHLPMDAPPASGTTGPAG